MAYPRRSIGLHRAFKHAQCGTALDAAGRWPRCELAPAPGNVVTEPRRGRRRSRRDDPVALALRAPHRLLEPIEA